MIHKYIDTQNKISINLLVAIIVLVCLPLFDGGFDHPITYWLTLLMILVIVYSNLKKQKSNINQITYPFVFYILLLSWSLISLFWTVNYVRTIIEFIQLISYGLVYIIVIKLDRIEQIKLGKFVIFTGFLITILALVENIFVQSSRLSGTFTNPNPFGIYVVILFIITFAYELEKPNILSKFISIIFLSTIILSGSKGSFISLLIALPFIYINFSKKIIVRKLIKTILVFLIAIVLSKGIILMSNFVQSNLYPRSLLNTFVRIDSFIPSSLTGRLEFWKVAGKLILNEPFKGYGLGTYYAAYYLEYGNNLWYARFTHNHYLQMFVELGFFGFISFLSFIVFSLYEVFKRARSKDLPFYYMGLTSAIIAFTIHIGMDFSWNFPGVTILFFAMLAILHRNSNNNLVISIRMNKKIKILILILLSSMILWHVSAQAMYKHGLNLAIDGNYKESSRVYKNVNKIYPISSIGYSLLSQNYYKLFQKDKQNEDLINAIIAAEQSVKLSPIDGNLHNKLGKLYLENNNYKKAEKHLKLGVEYGAYSLSRSLDLANLYFKNSYYKRAEKVLLKALQLQPISFKRATANNKDRVIIETLKIRLYLRKIYHELDIKELESIQANEIREMFEENIFLERDFK